MNTNVMSFPSPGGRRPAATRQEEHPLEAAFKDLLRKPQAVNPSSPGGKGAAYGAYNMPIFYLPDGTVLHTAGQYTNKLRGARAHTLNALELRCDALGLAVYVAGIVNLTSVEKGGAMNYNQGIRVVVYDYDNVEPSRTITAPNPDSLDKALRDVLIKTYNRLAQAYNLAGMNKDWLALKSTSEKFPDIHLDR